MIDSLETVKDCLNASQRVSAAELAGAIPRSRARHLNQTIKERLDVLRTAEACDCNCAKPSFDPEAFEKSILDWEEMVQDAKNEEKKRQAERDELETLRAFKARVESQDCK